MTHLFMCAIKNEENQKKIEKNGEVYLGVPQLCQYPSLPTGCESVAATMVLQYYNEAIQAETFADRWLEKDECFYRKKDRLYGPDPNKVFVGNPFTRNSYGCFAKVIEKAVNVHSSLCHAKVLIGDTLESLCERYINKGKPLVIWATMGMKAAEKGNQWWLQDECMYQWKAGEHCLVLVGYDRAYYYLNDPMSGGTVAYDKEVVDRCYEMMGAQAVYIYPKNDIDFYMENI